MNEVFIVSVARSPIGAMSGSLAGLTGVELGKQAIRAAVERATGQTDAGPMQALPSLISDYFSRLTNGRYSSVALEQMIPLHATGVAVRDLPVERLSRGTKTSLALATRLALAEAYLQERSGVIMLDDPCVDMDAERRAAAMPIQR